MNEIIATVLFVLGLSIILVVVVPFLIFLYTKAVVVSYLHTRREFLERVRHGQKRATQG
jgi:branched-subunit amino acid permease